MGRHRKSAEGSVIRQLLQSVYVTVVNRSIALVESMVPRGFDFAAGAPNIGAPRRKRREEIENALGEDLALERHQRSRSQRVLDYALRQRAAC